MAWNMNDLSVFVAVISNKSITAAANKLGIQKSTISRSLERLESHLHVRLIERNNRNIRPTSDGQRLYEELLPTLDKLDSIYREFMGGGTSGNINISTTIAFSREIISPALFNFTDENPNITLNIKSTTGYMDFYHDNIDIAIKLGASSPSDCYAKKLFTVQLCWYCSPAYLEKHPEVADASYSELTRHIRFVHSQENYPDKFKLKESDTALDLNTLPGVNVLEDVLMIRDAIISGSGVGLLPDVYCNTHVSKGRLIKIAPQLLVSPHVDVLAIYPGNSRLSSKLALVLSFLETAVTAYLAHSGGETK